MSGIKVTLKYVLLLFVTGCIVHGCNVINPAEPIPTFIHVDSFAWDNSVPDHGLSHSHQINTVWVYYNNNPIGEFDLPVTFPVITSGTTPGHLTFYPGISVSGQNNFLTKYPFYQPDTSLYLTPQPGKTINYTPKTSYYSGVKDTILANFKFLTNFKPTSTGDPVFLLTSDPAEGSCGWIHLNRASNDTLSEDTCTITFPINYLGNTPTYIEISYKSTVPVFLGMKSGYQNTIFFGEYLNAIAPSDTWKKFYFAVADFAAQYKGDTYTFFLKAGLDPGVDSGDVYLANIQLVHF